MSPMHVHESASSISPSTLSRAPRARSAQEAFRPRTEVQHVHDAVPVDLPVLG